MKSGRFRWSSNWQSRAAPISERGFGLAEKERGWPGIALPDWTRPLNTQVCAGGECRQCRAIKHCAKGKLVVGDGVERKCLSSLGPQGVGRGTLALSVGEGKPLVLDTVVLSLH